MAFKVALTVWGAVIVAGVVASQIALKQHGVLGVAVVFVATVLLAVLAMKVAARIYDQDSS